MCTLKYFRMAKDGVKKKKVATIFQKKGNVICNKSFGLSCQCKSQRLVEYVFVELYVAITADKNFHNP